MKWGPTLSFDLSARSLEEDDDAPEGQEALYRVIQPKVEPNSVDEAQHTLAQLFPAQQFEVDAAKPLEREVELVAELEFSDVSRPTRRQVGRRTYAKQGVQFALVDKISGALQNPDGDDHSASSETQTAEVDSDGDFELYNRVPIESVAELESILEKYSRDPAAQSVQELLDQDPLLAFQGPTFRVDTKIYLPDVGYWIAPSQFAAHTNKQFLNV